MIVETADAVMVGAKDRVQDVKKVVEALLLVDRPEATHHRKVWRPWGSYESLVVGEQFQVKRLTVQPGQMLSPCSCIIIERSTGWWSRAVPT